MKYPQLDNHENASTQDDMPRFHRIPGGVYVRSDVAKVCVREAIASQRAAR